MESFAVALNRYKPALVFCLCLFTSILFLNLSDSLRLKTASHFGRYALLPAHLIIGYAGHLARLDSENRRLLEQTSELSIENLRFSQLAAENTRLRDLLNFVDESGIDLMVARILSRSGGQTGTSLFINRGNDDGIKPGMAVITPGGLVGRIADSFRTSASVNLITDPRMRVSVYSERSRVLGITRWSAGRGFVVDNIPRRSAIEIGDLMITTGYGGTFPRGIGVGRVSEVQSIPSDIFLDVRFNPAADLGDLQEVLVEVEPQTDVIKVYIA